MKTVQAPYKHFQTQVNGRSYTFTEFRCVMDDLDAEELCRRLPGQYLIVGQSLGNNVNTVLVKRDMGLGDVLMVTPTLRHLFTIGKRVSFACKGLYVPMFENLPYLDSVYDLDRVGTSMDGNFDSVIDLRMVVENNENASRHMNRVFAFGKAAGIEIATTDKHLDYIVKDDERGWAQRQCYDPSSEIPIVGVVWRASMPNRSLLGTRNLDIMKALLAHGYRVALFDHEPIGHGLHYGRPALIDGTGKWSIRQTAAIMEQCACVIAPDSGLFHLASAIDLPVIGYFGAFPIEERDSHDHRINVQFRNRCGMLPCRQYNCMNKMSDGTSKCISIEPHDILSAVASMVGTKYVRRDFASSGVVPVSGRSLAMSGVE